jgi:hypothetical protein
MMPPAETARASSPRTSQRPETAQAPQQLQPPRLAGVWAAGVYALATLLLAYPALGGAFLVNPRSDQYIAGYAFREFAAQSLKAGEGFPQWNPYLFGGMPYIAGMHGDIFYPTFLLRMILPTDVAMTWGFIIHIFLAGFFTYGFLRAWGVGFYGALVGGLAYMLSGPIAAYVSPGHDGKLFVSALLPLTLWLLVRGVRDGRNWAWGALAITIGMAVLSPHPQLLQYLLLTSGAFALYLALATHDSIGKLPRDVAIRRLGLALGAVIIGGVIGAVQYLPVREYVDWSPRAGGAGWAHAISYSLPTEELLNAFVPEFSGILDNYWGRNGIHLHSEYPGIVVLVLATAGMFAATARKSFRWFWLGMLVVSLLWALGGSTPFYRIVYALVPGTKFFRAPSTMMYVTMFSLAVFSALGSERIARAASSIPKRFLYIWVGAIAGIALLLAMGLPTAIANSIANAMSAAGYPSDSVARKIDLAEQNQTNVILGSLRSVAFVLLTLSIIWAAARARISARATAIALAVLVALDLWIVERQYWTFSPSAKVLYATDPALEAIRNAAEPGRVTAVDFTNASVDRDPAFLGAVWMTHRVRSIAGYHGNELGRYRQILNQSSRVTDRDGLRPEFWRHENLHYLYTTLPDSLMPLLARQLGIPGQFTKVVGPVQNAAGSTIYLYRVPGDNPAAWIATSMAKASDDEAMATVLNPAFDPQRFAIVDPDASVPAVTLSTLPPPAGVKVTVGKYEAREINVQFDKPVASGMALVVSENFFPGWQANVSGQNASVFRANYNLIGVALPAGARGVQLTFSDPAYVTGKTVTLVALTLAVAALIAGVVFDRRRLAAPRPALAV